jgi:hypothetical protein
MKNTNGITVSGKAILDYVMRDHIRVPVQVENHEDDSLRADRITIMEHKANELLEKMAKLFFAAFPVLTDFIEWIATSNELVYENKGATHAGTAERLNWWFGYDLLPKLIKAKTSDKRTKAVIDMFENASWSDHLSKGLSFINYLTFDRDKANCLVNEDAEDDLQRCKDRHNILEGISELGAEYERLGREISSERMEQLKKKQKQEQRDRCFEWLSKSIDSGKQANM